MATTITFIQNEPSLNSKRFRLQDGANVCEISVWKDGMQVASDCGNVRPYKFSDVIEPRQAGDCPHVRKDMREHLAKLAGA